MSFLWGITQSSRRVSTAWMRAHREKLHRQAQVSALASMPVNWKNHRSVPRYVVDHIKALKRGGADEPSNMQWQTVAAAKAKDRTED